MNTTPSLDIEEAARSLARAEADVTGIEPLTTTYPGLTVEDAYRIQRVNTEARTVRGERITGRKIGLTSLAMQKQLGVDQPDFGAITDALEVPDGSSLDPELFVKSRLEPEFAVELGRDLPAEPTYEDVRDAVSAVGLAFEVIDSRIADWKITLPDTVADNASMARVVWGEFRPATTDLLEELPGAVITMFRDDEQVAQGAGSAVLGDPILSVHWLARALGAQGDTLKAGDKVLSGAVDAAVDFTPGSRWRAECPGFSTVELNSATARD
ncbi:MAG TPA: fumarylacetoacetate hydrolase family protein [Candidatus Corynebacterium avicola]|uniref:Fumarylacetoacetate hydrolase family protein n=1 Tax=Candidatus Corynebacterium avicola TaxID=2838527 RepID=A0A9D1UKX2_9CORY|nr:fumarylacetoacetate hydrolase family protein [Candidatus Corynebacterium avicola]